MACNRTYKKEKTETNKAGNCRWCLEESKAGDYRLSSPPCFSWALVFHCKNASANTFCFFYRIQNSFCFCVHLLCMDVDVCVCVCVCVCLLCNSTLCLTDSWSGCNLINFFYCEIHSKRFVNFRFNSFVCGAGSSTLAMCWWYHLTQL